MSPLRSSAKADEFYGERHVYEPHRAGLPPFGPYFRELWRRRSFAFELARTQMRAANTDTVFGQLWLVINPLLLAGVYFLLVNVINGRSVSEDPEAAKAFFALLTSGLFLYYFITGAMQNGTTSVTAGGRLILNTPFPKMLLTVSTTYLAMRRYLPTLMVYVVIHILCDRPWGWQMLWMFPIWAMAVMMGLGPGQPVRHVPGLLPRHRQLLAVLHQDLALPLPDPVDRGAGQVQPWPGSRLHDLLLTYSPINPIFGILGAQSEVLNEGISPSPTLLLYGLAWSVGLLVVGSLLLMSREREFAVRL